MALVKNTFNSRIVNSARLERQFRQTAQVVSAMPVKKLSYPRVLSQLPAVRDAILADLSSAGEQRAACGDYMRLLKRLTQLTAAERRILIRALLVVGVARAALWILPIGESPESGGQGGGRRGAVIL